MPNQAAPKVWKNEQFQADSRTPLHHLHIESFCTMYCGGVICIQVVYVETNNVNMWITVKLPICYKAYAKHKKQLCFNSFCSSTAQLDLDGVLVVTVAHYLDIVLGVSPIAVRVEVTEFDDLLTSKVYPRDALGDLPSYECLTWQDSTARYMPTNCMLV